MSKMCHLVDHHVNFMKKTRIINFIQVEGSDSKKGGPEILTVFKNSKSKSDSESNCVEEDDSFEMKVKKIIRENQVKSKDPNRPPLGFIQQTTKVFIFINFKFN